MRVTKAMIEAAQRGADRFTPTPKAVVRAMLEAALAAQPKLADLSTQPDLATKADVGGKPRPKLVIVTARKPAVRH